MAASRPPNAIQTPLISVASGAGANDGMVFLMRATKTGFGPLAGQSWPLVHWPASLQQFIHPPPLAEP